MYNKNQIISKSIECIGNVLLMYFREKMFKPWFLWPFMSLCLYKLMQWKIALMKHSYFPKYLKNCPKISKFERHRLLRKVVQNHWHLSCFVYLVWDGKVQLKTVFAMFCSNSALLEHDALESQSFTR